MKGISYLARTILKNQLRELIRTPARLIGSIFIAALFVLMLFSSPAEDTVQMPRAYLTAGVAALYALMFFLIARSGLNAGASFYSMADIGLLFTAPISSRTILFYGLFKQLGTSLALGFVLVFQYSWLHNLFGIDLPDLTVILLGYAFTVFSAQLASMLIYSLTAGSDRRRGIAKGIFGGAVVLAAAAVGVPALTSGGSLLEGAVAAANGPLSLLILPAGWVSSAVRLRFGGELLPGAAGAALSVLFLVLMVFLITQVDADFYEDVLKATEVSHTALTAKKEGKVQDVLPQNIKVGKTGIGSGKGALAFYYKHKLENRRARVFLMDGLSLIMAAMTLAFGFFMRDSGGVLAAFAFACYLQLFTTASGRWVRELLLPYVYMVPQPAFQKLVAICLEQVRASALEALIVMIPLGLICGASPVVIAAMVAARIGYSLFFIAGNLLIERVLGWLNSKTVILFLYFLIMIVLAVPGIILAVAASALLPWGTAAALLATLVWNLLLSAAIVFFCRDVLLYVELNNR